mgnify:CR=1 FL=1
MKGNKLLIIVGGFVVVGVIAYEIYKHLYNVNDDYNMDKSFTEDDSCIPQDDSPASEVNAGTVAGIFEAKEAAAGSVKERHFEAAKAMEESLNTIFKGNAPENIVTENDEALRKTSDDLDDLLK